MSKQSDRLVFSVQGSYVAPPGVDNANALRWAEMFNFGFTCTVAPTTGSGAIGLFKPGVGAGAPTSIDVVGLPVPTVTPPVCLSDFNHDGNVDPDDIADFVACYFSEVAIPGNCPAADFNGFDGVNPDDLGDFIAVYFGTHC